MTSPGIIRSEIKAGSKLGCSLKKLMTEISTTFGPSCVSYDTVRRSKKKFESGVESIKNAPKSGRPKSASRKEVVSKIKEIIEGDARFTVRDIARKVGISLSTVRLILKKYLKVRKISARWVPHLLTDEQKRQIEISYTFRTSLVCCGYSLEAHHRGTSNEYA